ncbi:uncharacterized protein METZ01_LOCUS304448 [marine metagenome]|uniref:Uncharacterized protein n=1 Tax=marine metagenome TaxID=408172 RepID=A0A382MRJ2_9ZZZZ
MLCYLPYQLTSLEFVRQIIGHTGYQKNLVPIDCSQDNNARGQFFFKLIYRFTESF